MKKIILVANRTNSFWFFRKEIIKQLIKKKYKVILVANKDEYLKKFKNYDIKFYEFKDNVNSFNPVNIIKLYFFLVYITLKHKPKIIQSYTIVPNLVCPFLKLFNRKIKIFCMITGMGYVLSSGSKILLYFSSFLYKISLFFCDHLIFTNKSNLNFFIQNKLYNKSYSLIPASGVNKKKYFEFKKKSKSKFFKILFVGRLIKSKGIFDLFSIFEKLNIKNKKLIIIGKKDIYSPEGIEINKLLNTKKNITHIKESGNLNKYYNNSDIFLFPSYSEGMPTVVMEAFCCGLPCFTYKVPGCDDIIKNNKTGFKVKLHSINKMINVIEDKIKNKNNLKRISKNCIKYSKKFDREVVIQKVVNLYEKFI
jgi:glycosyltransferase involved in cell wall biosynthesis